ncbi:MAG: hypothetical protein IJI34_00460 [Clostridia bacterium]|nr:hypothetical protein [Clostridia bacterium]
MSRRGANKVSLTISSKALDLLEDTIISKAKQYIEKYSDKTSALVFSDGLNEIRTLLTLGIKKCNEGKLDRRIILNEVKLRIQTVNRIMNRMQRQHPISMITKEDKETMYDIEQSLEEVFGKGEGQLLSVVMPLLLEAGRNEE